jgi:hypothetical protein
MKTKTFFTLCLLLGSVLTQLSAQPEVGKSGNMIINGTFDYVGKVPLNCDYGNLVYLVGTVRSHAVFHYSNYDGNVNDFDWSRQEFHGELVLKGTNEVFKVSDEFTWKDATLTQPATGHSILIGNQGSVYIINYLWDNLADYSDITIVSIKCPGGN